MLSLWANFPGPIGLSGQLCAPVTHKVLTDGQLFSLPQYAFLVTTCQNAMVKTPVVDGHRNQPMPFSNMCLTACSSSGSQVMDHCRNLFLAFIYFGLGLQRRKHGGEKIAQCMQKMDKRDLRPTEFDHTPSTNAQRVAKATMGYEISLNFEAGLFHTAHRPEPESVPKRRFLQGLKGQPQKKEQFGRNKNT